MQKNRAHSYLWDFKKCAFLRAVKCAEVSSFNSTSVICLINKTMLDVLYCSRERLDQPESYHMELKTNIPQDIATSQMMLSRKMTLCDYVTKTYTFNVIIYMLLLIM